MTTFPASHPRKPAAHVATERLADGLAVLDPVAGPLGKKIRETLGAGPVKAALSGTPLGHPAHPLLTDVVIGCFTSVNLLDVAGGESSDRAARVLLAAGLAAAGPTVATGWSDWADSSVDPSIRRLGVVHALANASGTALYGASLAARIRGDRGRAKLLALAGAGLLGTGGFLGGHLAYSKGVAVNQTAFDPGPEEWTPVLPESELAEGETACADAGGVKVLLARIDGRITAIANRCSHRGGPLHEGPVADGCVTCPRHSSVFRLDDGSVMNGPAQVPQPVYDVRVESSNIEVRAAG